MSGGSRGIGLAIAKRAARDGAEIVLMAKTETPDPRLPGTIYTAAEEIVAAGGVAHPLVGDVRDIDRVTDVAKQAAQIMGGIDIVINNASAISLDGFKNLSHKKWELMKNINMGGTFNFIFASLDVLMKSSSPRVVTLAPPLNMNPRWLRDFSPYTLSKYGMSMLTLGLAEENRDNPTFSAFSLWPKTLIATAAVANIVSGEEGMRKARTPDIVADAAYELLLREAHRTTGRTFVDEEVLRECGVTDFGEYAAVTGTREDELETDIFLD